jgi:hypothetical protein
MLKEIRAYVFPVASLDGSTISYAFSVVKTDVWSSKISSPVEITGISGMCAFWPTSKARADKYCNGSV